MLGTSTRCDCGWWGLQKGKQDEHLESLEETLGVARDVPAVSSGGRDKRISSSGSFLVIY